VLQQRRRNERVLSNDYRGVLAGGGIEDCGKGSIPRKSSDSSITGVMIACLCGVRFVDCWRRELSSSGKKFYWSVSQSTPRYRKTGVRKLPVSCVCGV
jgi:hypothetical protein